jgi:hypothetical protein
MNVKLSKYRREFPAWNRAPAFYILRAYDSRNEMSLLGEFLGDDDLSADERLELIDRIMAATAGAARALDWLDAFNAVDLSDRPFVEEMTRRLRGD